MQTAACRRAAIAAPTTATAQSLVPMLQQGNPHKQHRTHHAASACRQHSYRHSGSRPTPPNKTLPGCQQQLMIHTRCSDRHTQS
jgi:hypothetical protein